MKATGIVRRIDDLGRVVIPKEIRRTLRIREGDPLEIFTEKDGEVIFKKYSPMGELSELAAQMCDSLNKATGGIVAVADRDSIIAASGLPRRELMDRRISAELEQLMEARRYFLRRAEESSFAPCDGAEKYSVAVAAPILTGGDVMGCVIFLTTEGGRVLTELEFKLAQTVSGFLARQMEN